MWLNTELEALSPVALGLAVEEFFYLIFDCSLASNKV
jgi:hypothetical protein